MLRFLPFKLPIGSIFIIFVILLYHILSHFTTPYRFTVYSQFKEGDVMKPLKSKVSITLDEDLIQKIKALAEEDDRSFSQYINMVLKERIAKSEENNEISVF